MPKKKTPEEYYNDCKEKGYDLPIEDYKGSATKIKHKCQKGHIYEQIPRAHLQGQGCPKCKGNYRYLAKEYYNLCKEKGYDLPIEDYKGSKVKIKHECKNGHIYEQKPNNHLQGHGCFICSDTKNKSLKQYVNECKEKEYDLPVGDYKNNKTKTKHKCSKGHTYYQTPNNHLYGYGCPICNESHGEKFIRQYLDNKHIKYESQKTFNDLKDKTYLSYDFYVPDYNILIEYQGQQHYEECDYFGGEEQFELQQIHDKLKREYAKKNHYKLLELHYSLDTQDKVNKYLSRRIKD